MGPMENIVAHTEAPLSDRRVIDGTTSSLKGIEAWRPGAELGHSDKTSLRELDSRR